MAQDGPLNLRYFINLIHDLLFEAVEEWSVSKTDVFDETLRANLRVFPDLQERVIRFLDVKLPNPLTNRYGKHDSPFTATLKGMTHCHLAKDCILIYKLEARTLVLIAIVTHNDIEGKRLQKTAKRLAPYNPRT